MDVKRILIIGFVWPEPKSSAAGTRMIQLINLFLSQGYEVIFASAASKSEFSHNLDELGVEEKEIKLNDYSFNLFLKDIYPNVVLFDRYMVEEQFGWRVSQECPDAMKILDTEDLHCLRHARQLAIKTGGSLAEMDLYSTMAKREIASILRCDLSLIISEVEINLLQEKYHVDSTLIYYLPFLEHPLTEERVLDWRTFEQREGFVFIGNYLHEPNWHTLQMLKTVIWPDLRKRLPAAGMHIYGAYPTQKVMQLHNQKERFYVHGRAENARDVIASHKVLLAPIQFGAGVKGKFIDAMQVGTPAVTTSLGSEAMKGALEWNGVIADDPNVFITQAVELYQNKQFWQQAQLHGIKIINERYAKLGDGQSFIAQLQVLASDLKAHRNHNFIGQILQHHTANSTKYMSMWIEEKNKDK
ncbi:glycosyltransferase [Pedobacter immunditicola]|uniref:glycosyltransferase n=1 Tax=Pedobacter immunditicola TaxID=3133440 RepID=UPI0030B774CC